MRGGPVRSPDIDHVHVLVPEIDPGRSFVVAEMLHHQVKTARQGRILVMIEVVLFGIVLHADVDDVGCRIVELLPGRLAAIDHGIVEHCQQHAG